MFIQVFQGRVSNPTALYTALNNWVDELSPSAVGWLGSTGGVTSDGMFIGLARFESAEAARRNSDRPEQDKWWMETAKLFSSDVEFHDSSEVELFGQGGSDEAGFVQIMQGRVNDINEMRQWADRNTDALRRFRPDIIGGVTAIYGDNEFTQAVYFTSEEQARAGERKEPTPEIKEALDQEGAMLENLTYYDLNEPWLFSPRP